MKKIVFFLLSYYLLIKNGRTDKERMRAYNQRKVKNRPLKEELYNLIISNSFVKIGKMSGVSDKTIIKWCINYKLPSKRKEIKKLL